MTDMVAVHYWSDMANLNHVSQVDIFGFCTCEEQEYFPYDDCPVMQITLRYLAKVHTFCQNCIKNLEKETHNAYAPLDSNKSKRQTRSL